MSQQPYSGRGAGSGGTILLTLVSAALFLYVGFVLELSGISGNPVYDGSVAAFTWGARVVGIGLVLAAGVSALQLPWAAALDFVLSVIAAAGCLGVGAIWLWFSDSQGLLLVLFGLLNASSAKGAWVEWRAARANLPPPEGIPVAGRICDDPACGATNAADARFCQRCGKHMGAPGAAP